MINLENKTALVTGGSRGVGRAVAQLLARAGANVSFTYRTREDDAKQTLALIEQEGSTGWSCQIDLADKSQLTGLFARVDSEFPDGLDIFIANAGIWPPNDISIEQMDFAQWRKTMATNLDSVFLATQAAGKRMHNGGRMVYVGPTAGQRGEAYHVDYAATKGALISMVKGLCVEYGPRDITVNCVAPGWIDTEMSAKPYADGGLGQIEKGIPLGRVASAEDVAGPIVFLCSDLARHITGEVLNINGGSVLCG